MWSVIYANICHILDFLVGIAVILGVIAFIAAMIFVAYCHCSDLAAIIKELRQEQTSDFIGNK